MSITFSVRSDQTIIVSVVIYKLYYIPYTLKTLEFDDPSIAITTEILTEQEKRDYGNLPVIYTLEFREYLKNHKYSYEKYMDLL